MSLTMYMWTSGVKKDISKHCQTCVSYFVAERRLFPAFYDDLSQINELFQEYFQYTLVYFQRVLLKNNPRKWYGILTKKWLTLLLSCFFYRDSSTKCLQARSQLHVSVLAQTFEGFSLIAYGFRYIIRQKCFRIEEKNVKKYLDRSLA